MNEDPFDCEEFYNLMQEYRHMPHTNQLAVIRAYEAVQEYCRRFTNIQEPGDD